MDLDSQTLRFNSIDGIQLQVFRFRERFLPADEVKIPIVLLHGGGANAYWWDHIARPLAHEFRKEATVYALDFRGHGDSEYPNNHEVGAFGIDLESLLRWLAREDVILIGHSMGAAVALDHASRFPKTRGLVLADPARGRSKGSRRRARLALSFRRTYPSRAAAVDRYQFLPESSHAAEALRHAIATHSVMEEPDGRFGYKFDPAWFALPGSPPPDLNQVTCPTLLIRGEESNLINDEAAAEFIAQIQGGRAVSLPDAGHHVMLDQPEAFLKEMNAYLASLLSQRIGSSTE